MNRNIINDLYHVTAFDISLNNLQEAIDYDLRHNVWLGSPHEGMNNLTIDQSGKVGEKTFFQWCKNCSEINIDYDENNTNQPDGIYEGSISLSTENRIDVVVTNPKYLILTERVERYKYRYENKTARLDINGRFQHENIKQKDDCDLVVFLDYTPHLIYLTIMSTDFDIQSKHPVFGVTPHIRKDSKSGFKMDFGPTQIEKGIDAGLTLKIHNETPLSTVHNHIKKFLI